MASISTPGPETLAAPATVSEPGLLSAARRLRATTLFLEAGLYSAVAWTLFSFGGVPRWSQATLIALAVALAIGLAVRARLVRRLREDLGPSPLALHPSGRWMTVWPEGLTAGWNTDLAAPGVAGGPLLLPGLALTGWALLQLAPRPALGQPATVDPPATLHGILMLLAMLALHAVAATTGTQPAIARRRAGVLSIIGLALGLSSVAVSLPPGEHRPWGVFEPPIPAIPFGPFWYRNHFAACAVMLLPVALGRLSLAARAFARLPAARGGRARLARGLRPEALSLVEWSLPPLALLASLVATTSRGGILALLGGLAAGALVARHSPRRLTFPAAAVAAGLGLVLIWFGHERLTDRFSRLESDAGGRLLGWSIAGQLTSERPITGWGLNAYPAAVAHHPELATDVGAVDPYMLRAAHNDYMQVAAEMGLPGLGLALWAGLASLVAARGDAWRAAALVGALLHLAFDFDLQVPAVSLLFVVLAAPLARRTEPA